MRKRLHIWIFLVLLVSQCKQEDNTTLDYNTNQNDVCLPEKTAKLPQVLIDRFYFKKGTYWIYKNTTNDELDSMWVFKSVFSTEQILGSGPYYDSVHKCHESFSVYIGNKDIADNNHYYNLIYSHYYPKKGFSIPDELFGVRDASPVNNYNGDYRLEYSNGNYQSQMGMNIKQLDSLIGENSYVYKDVIRIYYTSPTPDYLFDMYYGKYIGLIKYTKNDGSIWELIRFNVIQ